MLKKSYSKPSSEISKIKPSWLTSLGILLALGWLFVTFLQEAPIIYLIFGGGNLVTMTSSRIITRRKQTLEFEGGVTGYLITWLIAFLFYQQKDALIPFFFDTPIKVNDAMILYLTLSFLVWFIVTPQKTSQELIWKLPPFYSNLVLNLWKFAILSLFLVGFLKELNSFSGIAVLFFLIIGFLELFISYTKQIKIDYVDIILNPIQLLIVLFSGPLESLKWVLLTFIFVILDQMNLDFGTLALIFTAIFIGIISFSTGITRLLLNSGVIESRVEEGKVIIPQIIEEIQNISTYEDLITFNDFYEVPKQTIIRKKNQIVTLNKGDVILRFPFTKELENQTGVFFFHLNMKQLTIQARKRHIERHGRFTTIRMNSDKFQKAKTESVKNFALRGSSVQRIPLEEWNFLEKDFIKIDKKSFASKLGFKESEDLEKELKKIARGTVIAQEQIRSRLRGVPAPAVGERKSHSSVIRSNRIDLPLDLVESQHLTEEQEVELLPGKGEYLFYVRRKK